MRAIRDVTESDKARFWAKVEKSDKPGACWLWKFHTTHDGYGRFWLHGAMVRVHRLSFALANGDIPDDKVIDHVCRVRACVRPDHLRAVTNQENLFAPGSMAPAKTLGSLDECQRGHLLEWPNLTASQLRQGKRCCLACQRARNRRYGDRRRHGIRWSDEQLQRVADAYFEEIMERGAA